MREKIEKYGTEWREGLETGPTSTGSNSMDEWGWSIKNWQEVKQTAKRVSEYDKESKSR